MVANPKPLTFPLPEPDLEELLADAIQLDAREQRSRLEVIRDALVLGDVLTKARSLSGHGYWLDWLKQTGIPRQRAHERIQLWAPGMTAEQVQEAGGIRQVLRQKPAPKKATESQAQGANVNDCARELAQAEAGNTMGPMIVSCAMVFTGLWSHRSTKRRRTTQRIRRAKTLTTEQEKIIALRTLGTALFGTNNLGGTDFADVDVSQVERDFPQDKAGVRIQFSVSNMAIGKVQSPEVSQALRTLGLADHSDEDEDEDGE